MGSTFGGLNILSSSLYAQQAALNTVGHNIANAGTEGYSRQRVNLATSSPAGEVYGRTLNHAGSGVTVASITRARDVFVDQQLRKESSSLGYSVTSSEALSKLEGIFTEPSDTGIQTVLNQFWTSWQTLATQASDTGARTAVAQRGVQVVNAVKHAAQQLKDTADNINFEVVSNVNKVNQISENIYKLNKQISNVEYAGKDHANDFRDARDLLYDELSTLVNATVSEDSVGNYTIQSGGVTLVDAKGYTKLSTATTSSDPDDPYSYGLTTVVDADGEAVEFTNGTIKALIDSRDLTTTGIKGYMNSLEKVSQFLLQEFNEQHKAGYGTDNVSSRNFFGADSTTDYTTTPDGGWINALQVNQDITKSTDGLKIIAAKKDTNAIAVTVPTNTGIGVPTLSTIHDWGTPATNVSVKVASVDSSGKVNKISYSTDDLHWLEMSGAGPYDLTIGTGTVQFNASALNSPAVNNTYKFSLSGTTVSGVTGASTNTGGGSGVPTAASLYDLATLPNFSSTDVMIKVAKVTASKVSGITYSTDGGANWNDTFKDQSGPYNLSIGGGTIRLDTSALTTPAVDNTYKFSLSGTNVPVVTAIPINTGSVIPTVSTAGTYSGGTTSTLVRLKVDDSGNQNYATSMDGGTTWSASESLTSPSSIKGMEVTVKFATAPDKNDTFYFSLSTGNNASGDNAILLGKRLKTDISVDTLGNTSLDAFYTSMIGALGVQSQDAQRTTTNQQLVVDQLTNLRQSVSGVSLDEEMTDMIKFQKGYNAAARVLTAMDEMLDKLINSTGLVGR